jgi:hypothetical protein
MENVEKLYSYGDMPPWGEGPAQQKIYNGPSYIGDNFPLTDKFLKCRTERLNTIDDDDTNLKVVRKADHITDEESFAAAQTKKQEASIDKLRLNSPLKKLEGDNTVIAAVGGILITLIALLLCIVRCISSRKQKVSKSS